ncbi:MAG: hypothetical protein R2828_25310 [Saprospiraceae bacterium]
MKQHDGILQIERIENTGDQKSGIGLITAKYVQYPDCQQLIIWLPQYGWHGYGAIRLIDNRAKIILDERPVKERLNGGIQILWDTLEIAPGHYTIEIEHPQGGKHLLHFAKLDTKELPPVNVPVQEEESSSEPLVYKDGFGNILPNKDLLLQDQLKKELSAKFLRQITYEGNFRSGTIVYREGGLRINFYHEMGGGDCKFYIDIPPINKWESLTKTALNRRTEILEFVASSVQREKASSWRYEIKEDGIYFY